MSKFYRKEEKQVKGKGKTYAFNTEQLSEFDSDGSIRTYLRTKQETTQGIIPQTPSDVKAQCDTCEEFITKEMFSVCEFCNRVCCKPCSVKNQKLKVCPSCSEILNKNRTRMMIRKFFLDPFLKVK